MRTQLVTAPAEEPVSLAEAKAHMRVTFAEDDDYISALVTAARLVCETKSGRAFVTQTWDLMLDDLAGGASTWKALRDLQRGRPVNRHQDRITVPRAPLQSVTSISYVDVGGTTQVLDPSQYHVSTGRPGRIEPAYGLTWPSVRTQMDAATVRFVAGYGPASSVPKSDKQAVLMLAYHWYLNRTAVSAAANNSGEVPLGVLALLSPEEWGRYS